MPAVTGTCSIGPECRARVLFAQLASGKVMPVDVQPVEDGNVAVMRDVRGRWVGRVLKADEEPDRWERRHMTHFATCPAYKAKAARAAAVKAANRANTAAGGPANVVPFDPTARRSRAGGRRGRRR